MNHSTLTERLAHSCRTGEKAALGSLAGELGFVEPKKTVANLLSLQENFQDCALLADIVLAALHSADPDLALNNLERLLATVPGDELRGVLATPEERRRLLVVLGASPFLTGILCRRASFFHELFARGELDRSKNEGEMLGELRRLIPGEASFAELQQGLRRYKCQEILRIGSRDLCGLAQLQEVTGELSALAASTLQRALEICEELLRGEFGAPLLDEPAGSEGEFTVLGMGKFGGRELNFSSDIDLIYFYSSERGKTAGIPEPLGGRRNSIPLHNYYIRLAEMLTRAIGQATDEGFVFRVDLRLRPDGNSGEMANSLRGAEVYYES
jgi:[glutamine synthetase] adenylyltransferase / [glutamine synthetase]-adenylyl-L-tyrosine phosphorylase